MSAVLTGVTASDAVLLAQEAFELAEAHLAPDML